MTMPTSLTRRPLNSTQVCRSACVCRPSDRWRHSECLCLPQCELMCLRRNTRIWAGNEICCQDVLMQLKQQVMPGHRQTDAFAFGSLHLLRCPITTSVNLIICYTDKWSINNVFSENLHATCSISCPRSYKWRNKVTVTCSCKGLFGRRSAQSSSEQKQTSQKTGGGEEVLIREQRGFTQENSLRGWKEGRLQS